MTDENNRRLRRLLTRGSPLPRQRQSRAARGFHAYRSEEPERDSPLTPEDLEVDEDAVTASLHSSDLPPPRFASLLEGATDDSDRVSARARRLRARRAQRSPDGAPGSAPATASAPPVPPTREPLPPDEVLRIIDAELDRQAIVSADANFVETGLLFGHQCTLRDADGNEIFIWSSNAEALDDVGDTALRFFVATDTNADGVELSPESALHLGSLLRALKTQVEVRGEDAFDALVEALVHYLS